MKREYNLKLTMEKEADSVLAVGEVDGKLWFGFRVNDSLRNPMIDLSANIQKRIKKIMESEE